MVEFPKEFLVGALRVLASLLRILAGFLAGFLRVLAGSLRGIFFLNLSETFYQQISNNLYTHVFEHFDESF